MINSFLLFTATTLSVYQLGSEKTTIRDNEYICMEIRGQLLAPAGLPSEEPKAPLIQVGQITLELIFDGRPKESSNLELLHGRTVVLRGMLVRLEDDQGQGRLVCKVTEGPTDPTVAIEYLVGYDKGQAEAVVKLCEELNLEVIESYETGNYLRIRTMPFTSADFQERLKAAGSVRYLDRNREVRIPELADPKKPDSGK